MKQMIGNEQIEEIIVSLAAEKEIISLDKNSVTRLCSADEMACWSYLSDTSDGERPLLPILRQFQVDKEADLADYATSRVGTENLEVYTVTDSFEGL